MALPSGTSISAADINSYLGRASGTSMSFGSTVRTLSNSQTPNMNGARGQSAQFNSWSFNQSSDIAKSQAYSSYQGNAVFALPNSPWRVIASQYQTYNANGGNPVYGIRLVNTKMSTSNLYTTASNPTIYNPSTSSFVYLTTQGQWGMLSDGTLVMVCPCNSNVNYTVSMGNCGIALICIRFDSTNGTISSYNQYFFNGASGLTSVEQYVNWTGNNGPNQRYLSTYGMLCTFSIQVYNQNPVIAKVDFTNNSVNQTISLTKVELTTTDFQVTSSGSNARTVLQSNGSIAVIQTQPGYDYHWWCVMNSAMNGWTATGVKYYTNAGVVAVGPYPNGQGTAFGYNYANYNAIPAVVDRQNNYYGGMINKFNYYYGLQAGTQYWTGSTTSTHIVKINAGTNTFKWELQLTGFAPQYQYSYVYKGNTYYINVGYFPNSPLGIFAIETDSSDNTYILYATAPTATGGNFGSSPINPFGLPTPVAQQVVYNVTQISSAGYAQWTRQLDFGPKVTGLTPWYGAANTNDIALVYGAPRPAISMLVNETISVLEIYIEIGPRLTSTTTWYDRVANQQTTRSLMLRTSDGAVVNYSDATAATVVNVYTLSYGGTTENMTANGGTYPITFYGPTYYLTTNAQSYANSAYFSGPNSLVTSTLSSVVSSSIFNLRNSGSTAYQPGYSFSVFGNV